ncbi:MAG: lipoprotein [Rubrivivax sp.]|nr:lipoprotein [Rubrivivax sp.]
MNSVVVRASVARGRRGAAIVVLAAVASLLAACGQKGPLTLPPPASTPASAAGTGR